MAYVVVWLDEPRLDLGIRFERTRCEVISEAAGVPLRMYTSGVAAASSKQKFTPESRSAEERACERRLCRERLPAAGVDLHAVRLGV